MKKSALHSFHIPVMGLAYTIDSPIRIAHYGIDSVVSIVDHELTEKMRAFYSKKFDLPYQEITQKMEDFRANRITSYLNMVDKIVKRKFEEFKKDLSENKATMDHFLSLLPNTSDIREKLKEFSESGTSAKEQIRSFIEKHLKPGAIDVNIMTKVDKDNFEDGKQLDTIHNDAHAALRGFAQSDLTSSVVLSAGMNPRLYSYFTQFEDFFPDAGQVLRKKIILKVSDYRSAMIQGRFLAQKGLWVSEYRIESGLNCGGHAFGGDGYLMGPILKEFQEKKEELKQMAFDAMVKSLSDQGKIVPEQAPELKITVQGGVGTAEEHQFLLDQYQVDSVGWGSPFLLVPEATSVDTETRALLARATEDDLYLSNISPLGVPFNTVKDTTNDFYRQQRIDKGKPGSSCPKKFLALMKEFRDEAMCTASRKYQELKIKEIRKEDLSLEQLKAKIKAVTDKACLCVGLANPAYLENDMEIKGQPQGVTVCPGPNMAYFTREVSLSEMVGHIYGNKNVMETENRPHMFIKELKLYMANFRKDMQASIENPGAAALKKLAKFESNLNEGIAYYNELFTKVSGYFQNEKEQILKELHALQYELNDLNKAVA